ncbi:dUTPase-like protein [Glomus cerebriforme]|uniref:Deoxyuridine 5'-triphosphate nucleotidohydrolase n=1 Tax=Glomus cerebriforme TaxID=658196 RepID=A0A397T233_9GLOM|nr:dUTPase-like protein [Glomus cerebriforme]
MPETIVTPNNNEININTEFTSKKRKLSVSTNHTNLLNLSVKRLSPKAKVPKRSSIKAAGYDLYSASDTVIPAKGKALVPTDLAIVVPEGTYGRVAPRSGLAMKNFIDCGGGVIDADYRGPVGVILFNHSEEDYKVKEGDRVAQLILERIYTPDIIEVEELDETERGNRGFGSTGLQ